VTAWRERASWLLHAGVRAYLQTEARRFVRAADRLEEAQRRRLAAVLDATRDSEQGRSLQLHRIRSARELQDAVPLSGPEGVRRQVEAVLRGDHRQLTGTPPTRIELTGGSSGPSKHVPMTRALLSEFHRALAPWLVDLLRARPALRRGPWYWSISPLGARAGRTAGGLPVGSGSDASYFPAVLRPALELLLAVPGEVARLSDVATCRYVTARLLLERADVTLISVWNPSFLTLLLEAALAEAPSLVRDLRDGTCRPPGLDGPAAQVLGRFRFARSAAQAARLQELISRPSRPTAAELFPRLSLVSCWTDSSAERALPPLLAALGSGVEVQGKGLLATEGVVTLPLFEAPAPVLAVRSHFYEFIDPERPSARPRLAHELESGRSYEVVMSTSGGLLRYRLGDLVRVAGWWRRAPCLSFVGRADAVVDLVGEKLSVAWASRALADALREVAGRAPVDFAMLGPEWCAPPAYHLFVDAPLEDEALRALGQALEARLASGSAYGYARRLGQLGPIKAVRVRAGRARYEARCMALGQRAGDVKPVDLHREPGWLDHFTAA
jgi:hypothetical protein